MAAPPDPAATVLERLAATRAGQRLLGVLDDALPDVFLVGGAVRDLLLGAEPRELDLVVEGDARAVAEELKGRLRGKGRIHEAFGTATVQPRDGAPLDIATARTETYARPGALPGVTPATVADDLARRDVTVNAIAVGVSGGRRGELHAAPGALEDLAAGRLRVLHDRSFLDDPTRLLRLVRYAARLGFAIDPATERLAREAFAAGAPRTAGVARIGRELWLLLSEPDPVAALVLLDDLAGGALDDDLAVDEGLLRRVLGLLPRGAEPQAALLAALSAGAERHRRRSWLAGMHVPRVAAEAVDEATRDPHGLAAAMRDAARPSELAALLRHRDPAVVALAGALGGAEEQARRWLGGLRDVRLRITGADLLAAGVPQGPEVGRRLDAALARKLDDGLATREDELAAALS